MPSAFSCARTPCLGRAISDPAHEPVWATAEELGATIGIHEGSSNTIRTLGMDRPFNPLILHAVSHAFEQMLARAQLIACHWSPRRDGTAPARSLTRLVVPSLRSRP